MSIFFKDAIRSIRMSQFSMMGKLVSNSPGNQWPCLYAVAVMVFVMP